MQQTDSPTGNDNLLVRAIASKRRVTATYNTARLRLEPHMLFFRHGEPYLLAHNVAKQRASDEQPRLGQYKLLGLSEIAVEQSSFEPIETFAGRTARDGDAVIITVSQVG